MAGELYVLDNIGVLQEYVRDKVNTDRDMLVAEYCRNCIDYPFNKIIGFANNVDTLIIENYGFRKLIPRISTDTTQEEDNTIRRARSAVNGYLKSNEYRFSKIIATMLAQYDPVENYSLTETEKINRDYVRSNDNAARVTTSEMGKRIGTTDNGAITGENTIGAYSDTTENGERTASSYIAPFNSPNMNPKSEDVTSKATDTVSHTAHTDSFSQEAVTNKITQDAVTDKTTTDATIDIETMDDGTIRELKRRGNIGVMTAAQMIEGERKIAMINLAETVAKELTDVLCVGYYCLDI